MAMEIAKGQMLALHYGRLKDDRASPPCRSPSARRTTWAGPSEIARTARSILGGNGILLDYPVIRHMLNLESVYTYEGTNEVHTLILGNALTGHNAF
jgi:glutaryl-CoA dehydrogenase